MTIESGHGVSRTVLPGGLRVVTEFLPAVRSVALGIWVGAGSRSEAASEHGVAHFLEHMAFKGTARRSAKDIAEAWRGDGFDLDFSSLFYGGERNHVVDYLGGSGWSVHTRNRIDVFADYGRTWPFDDGLVPLQSSVAVTAIRD